MTALPPRKRATKVAIGTRKNVVATTAPGRPGPAYTSSATSAQPKTARTWHDSGLSAFVTPRMHHTAVATQVAPTSHGTPEEAQRRTSASTGHSTIASA